MVDYEELPILDLENLSDKTLDELSDNYLSSKRVVKQYKTIGEFYHEELMDRLDSKGKLHGKHKILEGTKFNAIQEKRESVTVKPDAVQFFMAKGWERDIKISASISIKPSIDVKLIPKELLDSMNKYFDIVVDKEVDKDTLLGKLVDDNITNEEYSNLIDIKSVYALKVSERA